MIASSWPTVFHSAEADLLGGLGLIVVLGLIGIVKRWITVHIVKPLKRVAEIAIGNGHGTVLDIAERSEQKVDETKQLLDEHIAVCNQQARVTAEALEVLRSGQVTAAKKAAVKKAPAKKAARPRQSVSA